MSEKILVRMADDLRDFLVGVAVIQDFYGQMWQQAKTGMRKQAAEFTIEMSDDKYLFFASLFPRMCNFIERQEWMRGDWDCVLDFRFPERYFPLAMRTQKHVAEVLGIAVGANPRPHPALVFLQARLGKPTLDIILDQKLEGSEEVLNYLELNKPELSGKIVNVELRPANLFRQLERGKLFVGRESGATYLAAAMGLAVVEVASGKKPSWWLGKPASNYEILGSGATPEMIWLAVEETWQTTFVTNYPVGTLTAQQASTVELAAAKSPAA